MKLFKSVSKVVPSKDDIIDLEDITSWNLRELLAVDAVDNVMITYKDGTQVYYGKQEDELEEGDSDV